LSEVLKEIKESDEPAIDNKKEEERLRSWRENRLNWNISEIEKFELPGR
jgi:hypothetical protein